MHDNQICRIILQHVYQKMFDNEKKALEENPELKDVDKKVINENIRYLLDLGFINGDMKRFGNDRYWWCTVEDLNPEGIVVVENIRNELTQTGQKVITDEQLRKILDEQMDKMMLEQYKKRWEDTDKTPD